MSATVDPPTVDPPTIGPDDWGRVARLAARPGGLVGALRELEALPGPGATPVAPHEPSPALVHALTEAVRAGWMAPTEARQLVGLAPRPHRDPLAWLARAGQLVSPAPLRALAIDAERWR